MAVRGFRVVAASLVVVLAVSGCALFGGKAWTAESLRTAVEQAVGKSGGEFYGLDLRGAKADKSLDEVTVVKDGKTSWVTLSSGEVRTTSLLNAVKPVAVSEFPFDQVVAMMGRTCGDGSEAGVQASVGAGGGVLVSAVCGQSDDVMEQTLDGKPVPVLKEFLSAGSLGTVLTEVMAVAGPDLVSLLLAQGGGGTGTVVSIESSSIKVAGTDCAAAKGGRFGATPESGKTGYLNVGYCAPATGGAQFSLKDYPADKFNAVMAKAVTSLGVSSTDDLQSVEVKMINGKLGLIVTAKNMQMHVFDIDGNITQR